jgi:hypothetical protein
MLCAQEIIVHGIIAQEIIVHGIIVHGIIHAAVDTSCL